TESQPWWEVDLGQEADISQVNIYNRTSCCSERLRDFYILVSSQPFGASSLSDLINSPEVQSTFISGQIGTLGNIPFEVTGRYVRLQLSSTNAVLHMAEVEVMGCPADPSANPCLGTPPVSIDPAGPFTVDAGIQSMVANFV
ncbi:MAG: discoidin domain-containing protein, partial [Verrucomicrobiota bacterium]